MIETLWSSRLLHTTVLGFLIGNLLVWCFVDLYRERQSVSRLAAWERRFLQRWEVSLEALGGASYCRLVLVSVLGLFLELLMIRWVSSEVRVFAYLKNFVLIACFLGFGLGCYFCRRRVNLVVMLGPMLLITAVIKAPIESIRQLIVALPVLLGASAEVQVWGMPVLPHGLAGTAGMLGATAVIVPLFALMALMFIPLGQMTGWYLEHAGNGIAGYTWNIAGSLGGILLYTLLCFLYQPPAVWLAVAGVLLLVAVWKQGLVRASVVIVFLSCIGLAMLVPPQPSIVYWSPYQKLTLAPVKNNGELTAYTLNTNDSWYQQVLDLSPRFVAAHPMWFQPADVPWNAYNIPYRFYPNPPSVLVLGSGMGNDVAAALRNGSFRVVAVEIDPLILKLGRELHFEAPYASPRVQTVVDDARSYLQNSREEFDLIVFSLLDSHTTASHYSNIRIDNYVYTVQALRAAKKLLRPDGVFIVKFQVNTPWIAGRLQALLQDVFGSTPLQVQSDYSEHTTGGRFFVTGSPARIGKALAEPEAAAYVSRHAHFRMEAAPPTTDDWPYFYQRAPGLPLCILLISGAIILVWGWLMRSTTGHLVRVINWHFLFLGAGFMLLEAQIISRMALLFGTTWVVNSVVIAGLMVLIVLANILVARRPRFPVGYAYAGIFGTIALAYLIPMPWLLFTSFWLKACVATLVLCLPVFFAGIVFIRSFARAGFQGEALGSNLFGALIGGLVESLSLWLGLRALLILAAVFYAASAAVLGRSQSTHKSHAAAAKG